MAIISLFFVEVVLLIGYFGLLGQIFGVYLFFGFSC